MPKVFWGKLKESIFSILPLALVVIVLTAIFVPNPGWSIFCFSASSLLLIGGICFFSIGSEISLMHMGEYIGAKLSKSKKIFLMLVCSLFIGVAITIAEPDLMVLATQTPWLNKWIFVIIIAASVGIGLLLAVARILLKIKIQYILAVCYGIILVLMFFIPKSFLPIAFDASGVTTGPISVPFIMSFGLGIAAVRSRKNSKDDGFGIIALCSIGPIIAVMILSAIFSKSGQIDTAAATYEAISNYSQTNQIIGQEILVNLKDVAIILAPIVGFFLIFKLSELKAPKRNLVRVLIGVLFTYIGLVLFFAGVNSGYLRIANVLATSIGTSHNSLLFIPIGLVFGLFIALAEPAVHILGNQVEELSNGAIKKRSLLISMSLGISIAVVLSVIRILFEINIVYFYFPVLLACVVLSFFVPTDFSSIAFDSGGVASGAMSTSFILPFMQGVCISLGKDVSVFGFGTIGLIILIPILVVEVSGLKIAINNKKLQKFHAKLEATETEIHIIEFD